MAQNLENNKKLAMQFYDMAFNKCQPAEAIETYAGNDYIQHNPKVKSGKEGFIEYFNKLKEDFPGKHVEFRRSIAEGDLVVLHTYQQWPGYRDWASIDIFRFDDNGKIVEHWDVIQEIPEQSANSNTMF